MKKKLYHYRMSGLDGIYLADGFDVVTTHRGEGIVFHDIDGLHRAIGRYLVSERKSLSGREVRFLRKDMNLTQGDLGRVLGVGAQQVARWEKGQSGIPTSADAMLRLIYAERVGEPMKPSMVLRLIEGPTGRQSKRTVFTAARGWHAAKAA